MFQFALQSFCSTISSMTGGAVFGIQLGGGPGIGIAKFNWSAAHGSAGVRNGKY
jgi:hypothetical protein